MEENDDTPKSQLTTENIESLPENSFYGIIREVGKLFWALQPLLDKLHENIKEYCPNELSFENQREDIKAVIISQAPPETMALLLKHPSDAANDGTAKQRNSAHRKVNRMIFKLKFEIFGKVDTMCAQSAKGKIQINILKFYYIYKTLLLFSVRSKGTIAAKQETKNCYD
jgi:hypothetical protein